ncbi:hypothetical protein J5N97_016976 [Dioscorea zingiberensis]|uniref:Uncharacterized protein n=1 Tax=Dioscorea zingiberensis TaxID=325984 RepID=A0A9D5CKJ8_9LILI|nr:hypothetical protein J5N97_016976 [Dioscorea zingiberensis]
MVEFAKNLAHCISILGKKHVIVLSSLSSGRKKIIDPFGDMQIYYTSNANADGNDGDCEKLGWKRLDEYDHCQRRWVHLKYLAEGNPLDEEMLSYDDRNKKSTIGYNEYSIC